MHSANPVIRNNISEGVAGVPLNLHLDLQNTKSGCAPLAGYYIYIWHCSPSGQYSAYNGGENGSHSSTETYLRGIGKTDKSGLVTFSTVYPGWYPGRAVHIHVEIFRNLADKNPVLATQLAFPMTANKLVQKTTGYNGASGLIDNVDDHVFSEEGDIQMLTLTQSKDGYLGSIAIKIPA